MIYYYVNNIKGYAMKKIISIILTLLIITGSVFLTGCSAKKQSYSSFAMGSVMTATLYTDEETGNTVYEEINEALQFTDKCLSSTMEGADIYRLNESGYAGVDRYTTETLKTSIGLCNTLNRTLDITIGAVSELWGFSTDTPHLPDSEALKEAVKTVDAGQVLIDEDENTVRLGEGQKIDLGAIGKGAACEKMTDMLKAYKVPAVISFGGTVAVYGKAPNRKGWSVGVRNPDGTENEYMGIYQLTPDTQSGALYISTSGKYEKAFEENGKTYHHILSTETGMPVETDLASVTVISAGGLSADALSTVLFINGYDDYAATIIKSFDIGALFIYDDGSVICTGRYADSFTLTNNTDFTLKTDEEA